MSEDTIRKLASVQKILALDPIPGADRIEVATVLGWKVVVPKGRYNIDDLCIYVEVDSLIPVDVLKGQGLWDDEKGKGKLAGSEGNRLKTVRLRKQVSQGIIMGLDILEICWDYAYPENHVKEGQNVTDDLCIEKYEPPIPPELAGQVRSSFPSYMKKTDSHRIQAWPGLIEEMQGRECYVTIKIDGTSSTFYNRFDPTVDIERNRFGVCSRNMDLKPSDTNTYWRMADKYNIESALINTNMAVQAETYGPGIQKNRLGVPEHVIAAFDVFDIADYRYLDWDEFISFCGTYHLPMAPLVYTGVFKWTSVDELVDFASEQKYDNGAAAEGIVVRPLVEVRSEVLDSRMAFKVISPKFLLKHDE